MGRTGGFICICASLVVILLQCLRCAGSAGDKDPAYRDCVESCAIACFTPSYRPANEFSLKETLLSLHKWDCPSECKYQCMRKREAERYVSGGEPIKYHGKWPFKRFYFIQEPASVAFSLVNLLAHLWGVFSFVRTVYYKLPLKTLGSRGPYYEFSGLWIIYGVLSVICWLWSAVFHARDVPLTERFDYSFANAILGYSLILTLLRVFNLRKEEQRIMVAAPIIGFVTTHIFYLNFYELDYGWNTKVGVTLGAAQLLLWIVWAGFTKHPSMFKVWFVVLSTFAALGLEIFDFPPLWGHLDAHSLWHIATVPLTLLWWSFVNEDAVVRTATLLRPRKAE